MKFFFLALVIGEATGVTSFKFFLKKNHFKILYVISTDKKYHKVIKDIANKNKIKFFTKEEYKKKITQIFKISKDCDYLISIFSKLIISRILLTKFKKFCFNFHPGILPHYSGLNCVSGAIYNNEKYVGITMHQMTEKPDQGKIIFIKKIKLQINNTPADVMPKLRESTIFLLEKFSNYIKKNKKFSFRKNYIKKRKFFPKFMPNEGLVEKTITSKELFRLNAASTFGLFKSEWGNLCFIFNKKKYFFSPIKSLNQRSIFFSKDVEFVEKKEKVFYLNVQDKKVKIKILNNEKNLSKDLRNFFIKRNQNNYQIKKINEN